MCLSKLDFVLFVLITLLVYSRIIYIHTGTYYIILVLFKDEAWVKDLKKVYFIGPFGRGQRSEFPLIPIFFPSKFLIWVS